MTLNVVTATAEQESGDQSEETASGSDEQELPVVQLLKEQFGDYSDPQAYDWSWRETD